MSVVASRPISERIADALYERLRLLAAGYSDMTALAEVLRPTRMGGFTPKHLQIVLTQESPVRVPEMDYPGNPPANCYSITFNIRCHVMPSEKETTPIETIINTMAADVVQVVCDSQLRWFSFGELAIDAQWGNHEDIDADGGVDGVNVPLTVFYRVSENNPYQVRA